MCCASMRTLWEIPPETWMNIQSFWINIRSTAAVLSGTILIRHCIRLDRTESSSLRTEEISVTGRPIMRSVLTA